MATFFTGDNHFNHANIIKYSKRPFKDVDEMNETMIVNWNAKVKRDDLIYVLGDFIFGDWNKIIRRLNGKIFLILGSHDGNVFDCKDFLYDIKRLHEFKQGGFDITLCHYAMRVWPRSHFNSWHLYGHSHGYLESFGKSFDIGVDAQNFFPLSLEEVKKKMDKLPDNFNLVKKDNQA